MANKKNVTEATETPAKKLDSTKIFLIVFAAVALVGLIAGIVIGVF